MDAVTPTSATPPVVRLPLLLLRLLRAVTTAVATTTPVIVARDATDRPVLQVLTHQTRRTFRYLA